MSETHENIRKLQEANVRLRNRVAVKKPIQIEGIPNKGPKNIRNEDQEDDLNYEGVEDFEDTVTSLATDGGLPVAIGAEPSDPQPRMPNAPVDSQEENSRCSTHDRLGQREGVKESQGA